MTWRLVDDGGTATIIADSAGLGYNDLGRAYWAPHLRAGGVRSERVVLAGRYMTTTRSDDSLRLNAVTQCT